MNRIRSIPRRPVLTALLIILVIGIMETAIWVEPPWVWLLAAVIMIVTGVGVTVLLPPQVVDQQPVAGLLPTTLVLVSFVIGAQPWVSEQVSMVGAVVVGVALAGIMVGRQLPPGHRYYTVARRSLLLLMFTVAFGMYTIIYMTKMRAFFTATAIGLMTALVAFEMFYRPERDLLRIGLYTGICALVLGQITWVLNYWVIGGLTGGAFLLMALYATTGIVRSYFGGRLTRRLAIEYSSVLAAGFVLVALLVSSQSTI